MTRAIRLPPCGEPSYQNRAISAWADVRTALRLASEPLHLVVVPRVELARERRRWRQPELPGRAHRERHHLSPLGEHRRRVPGGPSCVSDGRVGWHRIRVRAPLSRLGPGRVRYLRGGPIGFPKRQHRHGRRLSRGNPVLLCSAIRDLHERSREGVVCPGFSLGLLLGRPEPRQHRDENLTHGRRHGGAGGCAGLGPPVVEVRFVAPIDCIERVVDSQVGHGKPAGHDDGVLAGEGKDVDRDRVPFRHVVGPGRRNAHNGRGSAQRKGQEEEREGGRPSDVHGGPPKRVHTSARRFPGHISGSLPPP